MPFGPEYSNIRASVGALRSSWNPDGRRGDGTLEMPADLWQRMMSGEITPAQARREWAELEPGQRAFNARLRKEAGLGFVGAAEDVLSGDPEGNVTARSEETGQFVDLNAEVRDRGSKPLPGGCMVPSEVPAPAPDANQRIRDAYLRAIENRGDRS